MPRPFKLEIVEELLEGSTFPIIRLATTVQLRSASQPRWSHREVPAFVDTGSPLTLVPFDVFNRLKLPSAGPPIRLVLPGLDGVQDVEIGWMAVRLLADGQPVSDFILRAGKVPATGFPVLLGADFLTRVSLVCNYRDREAHLLLRSQEDRDE